VKRQEHVTFCSKEAVVIVEPTNDGADVERAPDWVKLVVGPGVGTEGGCERGCDGYGCGDPGK